MCLPQCAMTFSVIMYVILAFPDQIQRGSYMSPPLVAYIEDLT